MHEIKFLLKNLKHKMETKRYVGLGDYTNILAILEISAILDRYCITYHVSNT